MLFVPWRNCLFDLLYSVLILLRDLSSNRITSLPFGIFRNNEKLRELFVAFYGCCSLLLSLIVGNLLTALPFGVFDFCPDLEILWVTPCESTTNVQTIGVQPSCRDPL